MFQLTAVEPGSMRIAGLLDLVECIMFLPVRRTTALWCIERKRSRAESVRRTNKMSKAPQSTA